MPHKTGEGYQDPCCETQNPETLGAGQSGSLSLRRPRWTKYRRPPLNASFFYHCKAAERGRRSGRGRKCLQGFGSLFKTQIKHPEQRRQEKLNIK